MKKRKKKVVYVRSNGALRGPSIFQDRPAIWVASREIGDHEEARAVQGSAGARGERSKKNGQRRKNESGKAPIDAFRVCNWVGRRTGTLHSLPPSAGTRYSMISRHTSTSSRLDELCHSSVSCAEWIRLAGAELAAASFAAAIRNRRRH